MGRAMSGFSQVTMSPNPQYNVPTPSLMSAANANLPVHHVASMVVPVPQLKFERREDPRKSDSGITMGPLIIGIAMMLLMRRHRC